MDAGERKKVLSRISWHFELLEYHSSLSLARLCCVRWIITHECGLVKYDMSMSSKPHPKVSSDPRTPKKLPHRRERAIWDRRGLTSRHAMSVYLKSRGEFFNRVFQVSHKMWEMMAEAIHESRKCPLKFLSEIICSFCLTQSRAQTSHSLSSFSWESSQTFSYYHLVECGMVKEFNSSSSRVDGWEVYQNSSIYNKFTSFIGIAISWCRWVHDISHPCHHVVLLLLCVRERRVRWGSQVTWHWFSPSGGRIY